jgi:hypothetical protein
MSTGTQPGFPPSEPMPAEADALARCGDLLRFATENVKDVPEKLVSTICAAWDAAKAKTWDVKTATEFWLAFNSLCALIKPVTLDTLASNVSNIPEDKWRFWRKDRAISLSRRSAGRYLSLLMCLLVSALILGFLASTVGRLRTEIEKLIEVGTQETEDIVAQTDSLDAVIGTKYFSASGPNETKAISQIQNKLQEQWYTSDQLMQKTDTMIRVIHLGRSSFKYERGTLEPVKDIGGVRDAVRAFYDTRRTVGEHLLNESIYVDVINSSILPIILGLMGACAYVVRLISEQIKETTFSSTSPVRHLVRLVLGGLAGVAIGYGGLANAGGLSPSALAFVAGYAVEPVFATFDSIAEKFRR